MSFQVAKNEDNIWLNNKNVRKVIETSIPTARSKTVFSVNNDTVSYMRD